MFIKSLDYIKWLKILLVITLISAGVVTVLGSTGYLTGPGSFTATYPAAVGTKLNSCGVCHTNPAGGGARNSYGSAYANNGHNFRNIEALDSDLDGFTNLQEITAQTWPGNSADYPAADAAAPTITSFSIPAGSSSLTVSVALSASDNVAVTGYFLTESATVPLAGAAGWTASAPASFTFATAGAKTLRAYAKDGAGNISAGASASTTVTLTDVTAPAITSFSIPASSSSLTVTVALSATDSVGVTGYFVSEAPTAPLAGAAGWTTSAPASFTFATAGAKTLRAYAKDGAGNISAGASASTAVTLTDVTAPTITSFSIPASSSSLTVTVALSATDNIGVTGYFLTESTTAPLASGAGWTASPPASYSFANTGAKTLRAYAKDGAGNVSAGASASSTISSPDTIAPTITSFAIPSSSSSLTVTVTLSATDNIGVTGYFVTESATAPLSSATGWASSAPISYTFAAAGAKTLRAYAKDGAGNVSAGASASSTVSIPLVSAINLIASHDRKSSRYNKDCIGCHAQVVFEQSREEPAIHTAHLTMAPFVPGKSPNAKCGFCHRSVDLLERSAGNVRRQVDVALCAVCHGPSRPTRQFYQTGPSLTQPNGPALYALVCSGCHGDLSNSKVRGKSASEIQNKIRENEGGMGPLGILTLLEIQAIANALRN